MRMTVIRRTASLDTREGGGVSRIGSGMFTGELSTPRSAGQIIAINLPNKERQSHSSLAGLNEGKGLCPLVEDLLP